MARTIRTRVIVVLAGLATLVALGVGIKSMAPADVEGTPGGVIHGTTDHLSPEEIKLVESDEAAFVQIDVETGDITRIALTSTR